MSQIASNSVPGNKSMSFLIVTLIFSSVTRLTLGVPTEFPAAFDGVKAVIQPEASSSSYWGFSDMISYGVESIQSAIKFMIGVEDHPREFYVVHIKDEKNPENSIDVLRERGREGIDKDIPVKGGKLPGNSLIVNPKDPVTEIVNPKNPESEHAPSSETTAPATNTAPEIPITETAPQNGNNTATKPATNGKHPPAPKTTVPPENPPAKTALEIPIDENIPQNGNNASTIPTTRGESENIDPTAKLSRNESTDVKSPLPPTHTQIPSKETSGGELPPHNRASETGALKENPEIQKSGNAQFNPPDIFSEVNDHSKIGVPSVPQNSVPPLSHMASSLDGETVKFSSHQTEPTISNHHNSPAVVLASSPAVEKIGQPVHEETDPWGQTKGESQNLGNRLPSVESSVPHSNNEATEPPISILPSPQYVNSNHNSPEVAETPIPKILEPLANQVSKKDTAEDDEFPDSSKVEETQPPAPDDVDPHIPEPAHQETQEPPSPDPEESTSVLDCETKYAEEYCEQDPESCDQFQSDEEFWLHIKQISGCEAKSAESSVYDPSKLIRMNECEIQYEKDLRENDHEFCKKFRSDEEFLEYVKQHSGCATEGEGNEDYSGAEHDADQDPFQQEQPSLDPEFNPLDFDGHGVQDYDNDALPNPQIEPVQVPQKKKNGAKKKSKSNKEKRSKSK